MIKYESRLFINRTLYKADYICYDFEPSLSHLLLMMMATGNGKWFCVYSKQQDKQEKPDGK